MADNGEINSEDFLPKDLLQAPLTLTKNIDTLLPKVNDLIRVTSILASTIKDEKASLSDVNKAMVQLNKAEMDLATTQKQVADTVQKETSYLAAQDTALNKLQQDYAKLRTEQERQSEQGKQLLNTIDAQNKKIKELEKSLIATKKAQKDMGDAVQVLDGQMGGLITKVRNAGEALKVLIANPVILTLTALVGVFKTLQAASESYYTTTMEGEQALIAAEDANKAFFDAYEEGWLGLGKAASLYWEQVQANFRDFLREFQAADTTKKQIQNQKDLSDIEAMRFNQRNEHLKDEIDDANTELKVTQLLEKAKDKEAYTAKERYAALLEGNKLLQDQEEGDIALAKQDLAIQKELVAYQSKQVDGVYDRTKSVLELTDEEIKATGVKYEEIKKLADLETALIKVESDAAAKRVSRLKLELSTSKEVEQDKKDEIAFNEQLQELVFGPNVKKQYDSNLEVLKRYVDSTVDLETKGAAARVEATKKELAAKTDLVKQYQQAQGQELKLENIYGTLQEIQKAYQEFYTALTTLSNTYTSNIMLDIQTQQQAYADHKAAELAIAGDNEKAKEAIDNRYAALDKKLKHEQAVAQHKAAVFQKATAIIQAAIQEALLIIKALATRSPWDIAAAIAGGIQVAAIAAKQVPPAYKKGTPGTPKDEVAIVGEEGSERITEPGKSPYLSPAKPTAVFLPKGTRVETHAQTMKSLVTRGLSVDRAPDQLELAEISRALERQTKVIQDKPFVNVSITERGVRLELQRAARKEHRLGSLYS